MSLIGRLFGPPDVEKLVGKGKVKALRKFLRNSDSLLRHEAIKGLGRMKGPDVEAALREALMDEQPPNRREAARFLKEKGWTPPERGDLLVFLVAAEDWDALVSQPLHSLLLMDVPHIIGRRDAPYHTHSLISRFLAAICEKGPEVVPPLREVLADGRQDDTVRAMAAAALGGLGDIAAAPMLAEILGDDGKDYDFRETAFLALLCLDEAACPVVAGFLDSSYSEQAMAWSTIILGSEGEKAIPALSQAARHENLAIRFTVGLGLAGIADLQAKDELVRLTEDPNPELSQWAHALLSATGDRDTDSYLKLLQNEDAALRKLAAMALGNLGDEAAIEPLALAAGDDNLSVQLQATVALRRIGTERARMALTTLLTHQWLQPRYNATVNLLRMGVPVLDLL